MTPGAYSGDPMTAGVAFESPLYSYPVFFHFQLLKSKIQNKIK